MLLLVIVVSFSCGAAQLLVVVFQVFIVQDQISGKEESSIDLLMVRHFLHEEHCTHSIFVGEWGVTREVDLGGEGMYMMQDIR